MTFIELAKQRYSCRNYDFTPVEQDKLELILEAGRIAPSAVNYQPWHFIVIRGKENIRKIHGAYHREWFQTAPCVIVVCGDHNQSWKRKQDGKDHCDIDKTIEWVENSVSPALGKIKCALGEKEFVSWLENMVNISAKSLSVRDLKAVDWYFKHGDNCV